MRVIIRFSVDGERTGTVRNRFANLLTGAGFVLKPNTATFEHGHISAGEVARVMAAFWALAGDPNKGGPEPTSVQLDHVWTYVDEPPVAINAGDATT